ncbi:hydrophobic surface binding protein A-domain-containing protein [Colletotrichum navitas]|uniref:Hydrophobic surface binding protein A-domain-containing protein n=1 Tax=Colletotrichum navitas TaxID=681940 RepID=A0AAD8UUT3_9PEZI|nr:hydrophobic surface binding protein A-domain-containing protein [Colletotrichum navitas]KAK1564053.1 hydrophobic surface binding protein A-domain-containing protein [Colletotrichum navitas]
MLLNLSLLGLFAASVLADGAAIVAAMNEIATSNTELGETVASWDGGLFGTLPILVQSAKLLIKINKATTIAQDSAPLNTIETITVAQSTQNLAGGVETTLGNVVDAKPKFDKLLLSPIILLNLKQEESATDKFSATVVEKVPESLKGAAETLVGRIETAFNDAIATYS